MWFSLSYSLINFFLIFLLFKDSRDKQWNMGKTFTLIHTKVSSIRRLSVQHSSQFPRRQGLFRRFRGNSVLGQDTSRTKQTKHANSLEKTKFIRIPKLNRATVFRKGKNLPRLLWIFISKRQNHTSRTRYRIWRRNRNYNKTILVNAIICM